MSGTARIARGVAVVVAVMLVLAGCGETSGDSGKRNRGADVQHNGSAATTTQQAALWDPCALPERVISATGLDPASKEEGIAGIDFTEGGWKMCDWRATARWYNFGIYSGTPTLDDVRARPDFTRFEPSTVGSREALRFRDTGAVADLTCGVAVELQQGVAIFDLQARASVGAQEDPCVALDRHVADLAHHLPD